MYRVKCTCGEVYDIPSAAKCPKCGAIINIPDGGILQIYRMGSPVGVAVGYGLYLDGQPFGHLENKESLQIPLAYGTHTLHCTCGMTRRCQDLTFTLSPEEPIVYGKARIKMGFWTNTIIVEKAKKEDMPEIK